MQKGLSQYLSVSIDARRQQIKDRTFNLSKAKANKHNTLPKPNSIPHRPAKSCLSVAATLCLTGVLRRDSDAACLNHERARLNIDCAGYVAGPSARVWLDCAADASLRLERSRTCGPELAQEVDSAPDADLT